MQMKTCTNVLQLCRWVDENHALALFSHPEAAQQALNRPGKYKLKPFAKVSLLLLCRHKPRAEGLC